MGNLTIQVILLVLIVAGIYYVVMHLQATGFNITKLGQTIQPQNLTPTTTTIRQNAIPQNQALAYALSAINKDRQTFNLSNVSYSNESSGQQHAMSMLQGNYFSHWDTYGLKPYMRYTLLGGTQSADENVAFEYNSSGVNVTQAIKQMEYNMMYNDSICCNNGHRDNILTPQHNQISIGVAYNATTIYFAEDFINYYINWAAGSPSYSNGVVALKGQMDSSHPISEVLVSYDSPVANMTLAQLKATKSYGFGQSIAGVGYTQGNKVYKYPSLVTVNATTYSIQGNSFNIAFNISGLISNHGAGEYTMMVWMANQTVQPQGAFIGAAYTVFIDQAGQQFTPSNI